MQVRRVGIVGCGVMGSGIAQLCAQAGYQVRISEIDDGLLEKGLSSLDSALSKRVEKGKITGEEKALILCRIAGTTNMEDFRDCDLMIEAAAERLEIKQKIFGDLDRICPEQATLATNTGSLSIIDIATATRRPERVIGLHFFNPPQAMKLVELVRTIVSGPEAIQAGRDLVESLGKTVVVAPDAPGFLVNRLTAPFRLNAIRMLEAGVATKEDIDTAAKLGTNMPMGPLETADLIGLDVILVGNEIMYRAYKDPMYAPPILLKKMVAMGRLGRKTGRGFYEYKTGSDIKDGATGR